jgi:putative transposase
VTRTKSIRARHELKSLLPAARLKRLARDSRFVERCRQLAVEPFVWTLALCFGVGDGRAVTGIFQTYLSVATVKMERSSFFEWMTKKTLPVFLQAVAAHLMDALATTASPGLAGPLGQFKELFSVDSTVIKLHDCLQKLFPGSRTNHSPAALKVHVVQKVSGAGVRSVKVTDGKTSDLKAFSVGPWVRGALLLMDLGYYAFRKFARIVENGGFFISRVKDGANPKILRCLRTHRGRAIKVAGKRLKEILSAMKRQIFDVEVKVEFDRRTYGGKRASRDTRILRLVGVWDRKAKRYHLYFTNLSPKQLDARGVAETYRLRWAVELLFRQLKGAHRLDQIPGKNRHTALAMIYAALISLLITRVLVTAVRRALALTEAEAPYERAARVIQRVAKELLRLVVQRPGVVGRLRIDIERLLLTQIPDPNRRNRVPLLGKRTNLMADHRPETMAA